MNGSDSFSTRPGRAQTMEHETLLRSALEADAESAPTGAGMLVQVRRRAAVRRARVRTAGAAAVVAGLAGITGGVTLLPLGGGQSLQNPATASVSVPPTLSATPTPTPTRATPPPGLTVPGLVEVPAFVPPRTLVPGSVPAAFRGGPLLWSVRGAEAAHDFRTGDGYSQLSLSTSPGAGLIDPSGPGSPLEHMTWKATTIAGVPGQQAHQGQDTFLRWRTADGLRVLVAAGGPASPLAAVRRFAEAAHPGVADFRPMATPHLMPAGWRVAWVRRTEVCLSAGGPGYTTILIRVSGHEYDDFPLRLGGRPARYESKSGSERVLAMPVDGQRPLQVRADTDRPEAGRMPSREQLEAIALAIDVGPGNPFFG